MRGKKRYNMLRKLSILGFGIVLISLSVVNSIDAVTESVPDAEPVETKLEAERARLIGDWEVIEDPGASNGAYVTPEKLKSDTALEFRFSLDQPASLKIYPVWWRHSEKETAERFARSPKNLLVGPDVLDYYENLVFFTCPTSGKVGIIDADTESVIGSIDIDGAPSDLIVDRNQGNVYIADATENKIIVYSAIEKKIVSKIPVDKFPYSLVFDNGRLYVACMEGKSIVIIEGDKIKDKIQLAGMPMHISFMDRGGKRLLVVRFAPLAFDLLTIKQSKMLDKGWVVGEFRTNPYGSRSNDPRLDKTDFFLAPEKKTELAFGTGGEPELQVTIPKSGYIEVKKGNTSNTIDVSSITSVQSLGAEPAGPEVMDSYRHHIVYFTAPANKKVGSFDLEKGQLLKGIDIGGMPVDIAVDDEAGKVYVADSSNKRIVVIDVQTHDIIKEIPTGNLSPKSLSIFSGVTMYFSHPSGRKVTYMRGVDGVYTKVSGSGKLFVTCSGAKKLLIINTSTDTILDEITLPFEPLYADIEYKVLAGARLVPKNLIVQFAPLAYDTSELAIVDAGELPVEFKRRKSVIAGGKNFTGNNLMVVGIDNKWLDVRSVADHQFFSRPLTDYDTSGTITLSIDDSREFDWTHNIWITPDYQTYLVNNTQEFWDWNARVFNLSAGGHVIRVRPYSRFAYIDALRVSKVLDLTLNISPEPEDSNWVFYYNEPVKFNLELKNNYDRSIKTDLTYKITDYLDQEAGRGDSALKTIEPGNTQKVPLEIENMKGTGSFNLNLTLKSSAGEEIRKSCYFFRIPKIEHPRLLFRKDEITEIKARLNKYPEVFEQFHAWLHKESTQERFLPKSILNEDTGPRDYRTGWTIMAYEFMAFMFNCHDCGEKAEHYFRNPGVIKYIKDMGGGGYYYYGSLSPGAEMCVLDIASVQSEEMRGYMDDIRNCDNYRGEIHHVFGNTLAFEEPLSSWERRMIFKLGIESLNVQRYFDAHSGKRGGNWWLSSWTHCTCPIHGHMHTFLYFNRNFLGEKHIMEKKFFAGFFTHYEIIPRAEDQPLDGFSVLTSVMGWDQGYKKGYKTRAAQLPFYYLSKNPLVAGINKGWEKGENQKIEEVFEKEGGMILPLALALGWYEPQVAKVELRELPETIFFDGEGQVVMRSGWEKEAITAYLTCGLRDVNYRNQPGDFKIFKGNEILIGDALWGLGDHGCSRPSWGNVVVVDDEWLDRWRFDVHATHPRADELTVLNRVDPIYPIYDKREQHLYNIRLGGAGQSYELNWFPPLRTHQHQDNPFIKEGEIIGFQTSPEFDYIAGDITNTWPVEKVSSMYRQFVFIKPDIFLIYDRIRLGPDGKKTTWLAATAEEISITEDKKFTIKTGSSQLHGDVILPENCKLKLQNPHDSNSRYSGLFWEARFAQRVLEIHPESLNQEIEYLIIIQIKPAGESKETVFFHPKPVKKEDFVGVELLTNERSNKVIFNRRGPLGGHVTLKTDKGIIDRDFTERIDDNYDNWSNDNRYRKWHEENRFRFITSEE